MIALGSLTINLIDAVRFRDWPDWDVKRLLSGSLIIASAGAVFLFGAYGLFRSRLWGTFYAVVVSALALAFLAVIWSGETIVQAFYGIPLGLALVWAGAEVVRALSESRRGHRERRDQIA